MVYRKFQAPQRSSEGAILEILITLSQRGMWAMIAVSIALVFWTGGLSYLTHKNSQRREAASETVMAEEERGSSIHEKV